MSNDVYSPREPRQYLFLDEPDIPILHIQNGTITHIEHPDPDTYVLTVTDNTHRTQ